MVGYGKNAELPDDLNKEFKDVWIFHGNPAPDESNSGGSGIWSRLRPGHGVGFSSNGKRNDLSERFGIELSFAKTLRELYPNQKIALIKYARGGTSIDSLAASHFGSWDPEYIGKTGINQYDHFLTTLKQALNETDINGDGTKDHLLPMGIIWMQGESDGAYTEEIATKYYSNLKNLMKLIRENLQSNDLPIVLGKISDSWNDADGKVWDYGELVQYAQEKFARTDTHASVIRHTRYYSYSDPWHYDSKGYIDLGKRFAKAIYLLNIK
jgi:hypothetical protein